MLPAAAEAAEVSWASANSGPVSPGACGAVGDEARAAAAEFDQKTAQARAEIYSQMDEMRRTALTERNEIMARPAPRRRPRSPRESTLKSEADEARRRLSADAEALGTAAADRILGRKAS